MSTVSLNDTELALIADLVSNDTDNKIEKIREAFECYAKLPATDQMNGLLADTAQYILKELNRHPDEEINAYFAQIDLDGIRQQE